jgi:hypothetical protein
MMIIGVNNRILASMSVVINGATAIAGRSAPIVASLLAVIMPPLLSW